MNRLLSSRSSMFVRQHVSSIFAIKVSSMLSERCSLCPKNTSNFQRTWKCKIRSITRTLAICRMVERISIRPKGKKSMRKKRSISKRSFIRVNCLLSSLNRRTSRWSRAFIERVLTWRCDCSLIWRRVSALPTIISLRDTNGKRRPAESFVSSVIRRAKATVHEPVPILTTVRWVFSFNTNINRAWKFSIVRAW